MGFGWSDEHLIARLPDVGVSLESPVVEATSLLALAVTAAVALAAVSRFGDRDPLGAVRERFVFGVPWGTVLVVVGLLAVYYLVQGGGRSGGPVVEAFRSWSLSYPQGTLFSSFGHQNVGHLRGNLFGTLAFAPLVEYVWRHRPEAGDRIRRPAARVAAFVLGVFAVGLADSLFVPGAVLGFSGVVFALAGFALVVRPALTVGALLATEVVRLVYFSATSPVVTARARPQFVSPSWADVALQGHLFGALLGILLGVALLRRRGRRPPLAYVFLATLVFAVDRSLWAVYWFLGPNEFVLYQALGLAGIVLLAALVALATLPEEVRLPALVRVPVARLAVGLLVAGVVVLSVSGLAYGLVSVSPGEPLEDGVEVRDYTVDYVENTEDRYVGSLSVPGVGTPLSAEVSGVVVASDRRDLWGVAVSASELAFDGGATVPVGDATWREVVRIDRNEWSFLDGNSTYRVTAEHDGNRRVLFTAEDAVSETVIDGLTPRIEATDTGYTLALERNGTVLDRTAIPDTGAAVELADIAFERTEDTLVASHRNTTVTLARFERSGRESSD